MMASSGTVRQCALAACVLLASASTSAGQQERALSISVDRSTVSPGETLQLTVGSPSGLEFEMVAVIVETVGIADFVATLPATMTVQIPRNLRPGRYTISAMGRTTGKQQVKVRTAVAVERAGLRPSLHVPARDR